MAAGEGAAAPALDAATCGQLTLYEILGYPRAGAAAGSGLAPDALSVANIRRRFRRLSIHFHPDKNTAEDARVVYERLTLAAETLTDPARRAEYDADLAKLSAGDAKDAARRQRAKEAGQRLDAAEAAAAMRAATAPTSVVSAATAALDARQQAAEQLLASLAAETPGAEAARLEDEMVAAWDVSWAELDAKEAAVGPRLAVWLAGNEEAASAPYSQPRKRTREESAEEADV